MSAHYISRAPRNSGAVAAMKAWRADQRGTGDAAYARLAQLHLELPVEEQEQERTRPLCGYSLTRPPRWPLALSVRLRPGSAVRSTVAPPPRGRQLVERDWAQVGRESGRAFVDWGSLLHWQRALFIRAILDGDAVHAAELVQRFTREALDGSARD